MIHDESEKREKFAFFSQSFTLCIDKTKNTDTHPQWISIRPSEVCFESNFKFEYKFWQPLVDSIQALRGVEYEKPPPRFPLTIIVTYLFIYFGICLLSLLWLLPMDVIWNYAGLFLIKQKLVVYLKYYIAMRKTETHCPDWQFHYICSFRSV